MDHPEVRAWLEEAALGPGDLGHPSDPRVAAHLETCPACAAERDALQAVGVALGVAIGPPRGARERVLAGVAELGRERRPVPARRPSRVLGRWRLARPSLPALTAALGVAVLLLIGGAVLGGLLRPAPEASGLERVAVQLGELIRDPEANHVTLRDQAGAPAGLVVHSPARQRLVVLSTALTEPADGGYSCYLERDAQSVVIGPMHFDDRAAYWAGPMDQPADAGRPGDRFVVRRDGSDGPPVLVGEF